MRGTSAAAGGHRSGRGAQRPGSAPIARSDRWARQGQRCCGGWEGGCRGRTGGGGRRRGGVGTAGAGRPVTVTEPDKLPQ
ncbi:hypothetical protein DEF24_00860 [Marinitenerispora sediminis]|uniref:Uncharacterized protein n=1 Tax=Marinitenerispora sediminis TaxID=1931232 RepID=A0A368TBI1_9ACTN|nr:hypothetical protein DEF24_00860 [Marinitenerispora sediminis]